MGRCGDHDIIVSCALVPGRTWWSRDLLIHPDGETITTHDGDRANRPNQDRQHGEHQQFPRVGARCWFVLGVPLAPALGQRREPPINSANAKVELICIFSDPCNTSA